MTGLPADKTLEAPVAAGAFDSSAGEPEDTIAAIATPLGTGGIAIIRVSGKRALEVAGGFIRLRQAGRPSELRSWSAALGVAVDPQTGREVDEVIALVMRGPRSYTGEDVMEVQCHGGRLVAEKILSLALSCGARPACPGEFTRRAYLCGRITLDQAEAILDLVEAPSEASLLEAGRRLKGELGQLIRAWEGRVLGALAALLAAADFPEDVGDQSSDAFRELAAVRSEIGDLLARSPLGLALASGIEVCLVGRPNVGKSSLFNALLGRDRAIVTEVPGTTRDVLRERTEWSSLPIILLDTAGLRDTSEVVEAIGVDRAREAASGSEVILYVMDDSAPLSAEDLSWIALWRGRRLIVVVNKADLGAGLVSEAQLRELVGDNWVKVSTVTKEGLERLREAVVGWFAESHPEGALPGSARQVDCLRRAEAALSTALGTQAEGWTEDVVVLGVESAAAALAELTGKRVSDEALDQVLSRFCVGK